MSIYGGLMYFLMKTARARFIICSWVIRIKEQNISNTKASTAYRQAEGQALPPTTDKQPQSEPLDLPPAKDGVLRLSVVTVFRPLRT